MGSDSWHIPLAIGVVSLNMLILLLMAMWFRTQVDVIVAKHTAGLLATIIGRHEEAERIANDARRAAFTVNTALHVLEGRHNSLEARVTRLESEGT